MDKTPAIPVRTRVQITSTLDAVLVPEGYSRATGDHLGWVLDEASVARHVDVEPQPYIGSFDVSLQTITSSGVRRFLDLRDLEAAPPFSLGQADPALLISALAWVCAALRRYGFVWLGGYDVVTPRMAAHRDYVSRVRAERISGSAAAQFRAGQYIEALRLFSEAADLAPLTPLHEKMAAYARKRAAIARGV